MSGFFFYSFVYDTAVICVENFVGYNGRIQHTVPLKS